MAGESNEEFWRRYGVQLGKRYGYGMSLLRIAEEMSREPIGVTGEAIELAQLGSRIANKAIEELDALIGERRSVLPHEQLN